MLSSLVNIGVNRLLRDIGINDDILLLLLFIMNLDYYLVW